MYRDKRVKVFSAEPTSGAPLAPFEPTERESRVSNILLVAVTVLGVVFSLVIGLTHRFWWPVLTYGALAILTALGTTAWAARTRGQSWRATFVQMLRTRQEPRGTWRERLRRRLQDP